MFGFVAIQLYADVLFSAAGSNLPSALPESKSYAPITIDNVRDQIGLAQNFFLAKLHANNDKPLIEDDDLPVKQRMPKPRLPPTGKITSPRKRPIKEPGPGKGHPRKKMKLNENSDAVKTAEGDLASTSSAIPEKSGDPVKKPVDAPLTNGVTMSREPSKNGEVSTSAAPPSSQSSQAKPLTNGVLPHSNASAALTTVVTPTGKDKGKEKEMNGDSLPSPASLEAT